MDIKCSTIVTFFQTMVSLINIYLKIAGMTLDVEQ